MQQRLLFSKIIFASCALVLLLLTSCMDRARTADTRVVIFLVVDQFWNGYVERYGSSLPGGLGTLLREGAFFNNTFHEFAVTETCPGHATIISGTNPARSGVVSNIWHDRNSATSVYCVQDSFYGLSPRSLQVSTLPDWIKLSYDSVRTFSVSGKDRSAILLGGREADGVFWYSQSSGKFETSRFYNMIDMNWLGTTPETIRADQYYARLWEPHAITQALIDKQAPVMPVNYGDVQVGFPHALGDMKVTKGTSFFEAVYKSPFLDELTWNFTERLLQDQQFGEVPGTLDFLSLSLSALDTVGHSYGPDSVEALDTLVRADQIIAKLLMYLERTVGSDNVLVVLTSDHGIQPFPEIEKKRGVSAKRVDAHDTRCVQRAAVDIQAELAVEGLWQSHLVLNTEALQSSRLPRRKVDAVVRSLLERCASIERVWTREELLFGAGDADNPYRELYRASVHKDRGPDYFIQYQQHFSSAPVIGTSHGSPYDYDRQVPFILWGKGIKKAHLSERIATIDIAPTVAELLKVSAPRTVEGVSRVKLLD